ncbi:patched family protein [Trichuris suis]|nr:patched family protein [Trichuris suis]
MHRANQWTGTSKELRLMLPTPAILSIDRRCVGKSGPSAREIQIDVTNWNEEFRSQPSWVDASLALKLVKAGNAKGNRPALWLRGIMQKAMFCLGRKIQAHYLGTLAVGLLLLLFCCVGLKDIAMETDMEKLWVEKGGRLEAERRFLSEGGESSRTTRSSSDGQTLSDDDPVKSSASTNKRKAVSSGDAFLLIIQTARSRRDGILTREELLLHVQVVTEIAKLVVPLYGYNWTLSDICFKPPSPTMEGFLADTVKLLLDKIVPCTIITPLDCFWEGSKPLGPFPPLDLGPMLAAFIPSLNKNISWQNLNPKLVIEQLKSLGVADLSDFENFINRAGIGVAFQNRPCLDPLDPDCPITAPNHFNFCDIVEKFVSSREPETRLLGDDLDVMANVTAPPTTVAAPQAVDSDYYSDLSMFHSLGGVQAGPSEVISPLCEKHKEAVRTILRRDENLRRKWLPSDSFVDLAKEMTGGCVGFASNYMVWPEDLIIGGVKKKNNVIVRQVNLSYGKVLALLSNSKLLFPVSVSCVSAVVTYFRVQLLAEALQSVFMMAGATEVYERFENSGRATSKGIGWSVDKANAVLNAWQKAYSQFLYDHVNNTGPSRQLHPMSGASINEMLEMFSQLNPTVMIVGYCIMVFYASFSMFTCDDHGVNSGVALAVLGCILVTLSSLAGLGCSTLLGIKFNPTTTQVIPFLSLGLGVDDMFLLLHNYRDIVENHSFNEIGMLLKETGLSALLTSLNNILAFVVGAVVPVPALRDFCLQVALVLIFNAITILTIYPAIMSIDLLRRKRRLVDVFCCFKAPPRVVPDPKGTCISPASPSREKTVNVSSGSVSDKTAVLGVNTGDSKLNGHYRCQLMSFSAKCFLKNCFLPFLDLTSVKVLIAAFGVALIAVGVYGVMNLELGLELTDLLPKGTPAYEFVAAREAYFSFFPFSAILKGPLDIPNKQPLIHEYRNRLAAMEYTVKHMGEITERYWLSMMSDWLRTLQTKFDDEWLRGYINETGVISSMVSHDAKLAYKLLCNKGEELDCSRVGNVKLVDANGFINPDGFYNYLTAWFNIDQMAYYLSQASFHPTPPIWHNTGHIRTVEDNKGAFDPVIFALHTMPCSYVSVPPASPLIISRIPFFVVNLVDTPAIVDFIRKVRAICDEFTDRGLPNFPEGLPISYWQHYVHLNHYLMVSLSIICGAVFVTISLILFNPWAAILVVTCVATMAFELAGLMGLYGLKLNPVSVVTLITAVGIGVEFTVHMLLSFLTSMGNRSERMRKAVWHMFTPVLHGGLSTLLGLLMLAFSEFEFIVQYFFLVMSTLILLGIFNGLVVFPVLLSWIGPPPEVQSLDNSNCLPPPSPSFVSKQLSSLCKSLGGNGGSDIGLNRSSRRGVPRASDMSLSTITEETPPPPPMGDSPAVKGEVRSDSVMTAVRGRKNSGSSDNGGAMLCSNDGSINGSVSPNNTDSPNVRPSAQTCSCDIIDYSSAHILMKFCRRAAFNGALDESSQVSPVYAVPNGAEKPWLKKKTSQAAISPSPAVLLTPPHDQRTTMPPELYDDVCLAPRRSSAPLPAATGSYPDSTLNQDVHRLAQLIALNRQRKMLEQFYLRIKLVAYVHLLVAFLLLSSDVALIVILWPKSAPQQQLKLILRCLYAMYVLNIGIVSILAAVQRERALYVLPLLCIILIANFLLAPFQLPIVQSECAVSCCEKMRAIKLFKKLS